jgi:site-specific recombinase XerD
MKVHLKIILRNDFVKKDGTKSLYLRVIIKHKVKNIPLSIATRQKDFKKGYIRQSDPDYKFKNLLIDATLTRAKKIDLDARVAYKELTLQEFSDQYFNYVGQSLSFYEFLDREMPYMQEKLAPDTMRAYNTQISKLRKFRPNLNFQELDLQFIKDYERYMISTLGNDISTVNKSLSFVKSIINRAISANIITVNPFDNHPLKRTESTRQHLTIDELKHLEGVYRKNVLSANKANVLRYFLFCCYTGLRYKDIKELRFDDIQEVKDKNGEKNKILVIDMHKTGKPVRIPLSMPALRLMPETGFEKQKIFNVLTDQPTNRYLKDIIATAEIRKSISFHCSRHTFATVARALGIPLDIISSILGHTDLKTTAIYTKYDDRERIEEMGKWN